MKKVAVVMGSDSDLPTMQPCMDRLNAFGIPYQVRIISAHRTPGAAEEFASTAKDEGFGVIIAAAGLAAHLAGALAGNTILPVIGVPLASGGLGGMDALLATVQMPPGVPVATVAVNGAHNAAILAVQMLAAGETALWEKLKENKRNMHDGVQQKDAKIAAEAAQL